MIQDKKKKQDLGIFYTRQEIVDFIYDVLLLWKDREDKEHNRWESHTPKHYPSVIDPACGEGIFLKKSVEKGFTRTDWIFGLDIDEAVVEKWPDISLLDAFDGDNEKLNAHFFHQNGLKHIEWEQHKKQYHGRLNKKKNIEKEQFDLVIGNPPYGGIGLEKEEFDDALIEQLADYKILPSELKNKLSQENLQKSLALFEEGQNKLLDSKIKDRLKSFPIEVLFLDRFIQLCKPGGWIAVIIPDGILTNSNFHYVRKHIAENTKVEAIVSLPRDAFKHVGTSAKTSILFLKKLKAEALSSKDTALDVTQSFRIEQVKAKDLICRVDKVKETSYIDTTNTVTQLLRVVSKYSASTLVTQPLRVDDLNYPVFLASLEKIDNGYMNEIISQYKEFYMKQSLNKEKTVYTNEYVMVRVDKTLKDLMEEKPSSRWDSSYWMPKYELLFHEISKKYKLDTLDKHILSIQQGDVPRKAKGDKYVSKGIIFVNVVDIVSTGISWISCKRIVESHYKRIQRAEPKIGDIIFVRSGKGSIGKSTVFIEIPGEKKIGISGHLNTVRFKEINPFYVEVFLKSCFGQQQIERFESGTSQQTDFRQESFSSIKIPIILESVQSHIEIEYKKMVVFHNKAMEALAKGDEAGYKKNIETAETMLKELIARTEAIIRGERKDVI
ncbi:MAG: hypothetical protein A2W05_09115 [Candidatus Schekmanbacteria bacterium RBG_16_38_10]|uniref:site-specific DNA-methyltransferase (adenine-specific) n=1 Tax=Candidatus Schekmanbacteria bacterium RBG_16_38_10 TaxID=1817879 RepID=A0A1F7S1P5_9BACT|nr:MAG: hypothetical protein A2W05_09115 [Candidatus Schekmanbacteria bacterium RBG_16_38_10]